jgi:hypothetical protein
MSGQLPERLTPPGDLRPAQLGIILVGRVIAGHVGATLIDLSRRGYLRIEEVPGGDSPQWLLTDLRDQEPGPGEPLLPFEMTLLGGLFGRQAQLRLPGIGDELIPTLNRVRAELRRDAVRHGWLRRWRRDRRTGQGDQLLRQIQGFRRELRTWALSGAGVPAVLAPYMMIFGLAAAPAAGIEPRGVTVTRRSGEIPWARLEAFSGTWQGCVNDAGANGSNGRSDDFSHQWSAPPSHDHGNASHHSGYDGYGGGDHFGGGHGGFGHAGHP